MTAAERPADLVDRGAVIVLLAVGGGAYALVNATGGRPTAQPHGQTSTVAARGTTPSAHPASTQPASLQASTSPTAAASPSHSAVPSPSASPSVVSIAPGVRSASAPVEIVLSHYFQGINDHNYAEYASSQTAQGKRTSRSRRSTPATRRPSTRA